jgi:3-oxoadipate enol-lactonase
MTTYVDDALAVLDQLGLDRVHVYGHSFGAQVALELAATHDARVRTLILGAARPSGARSVASVERAPLDRPWELLYSRAFLVAHPDEVDADRAVTRRRPDGERLQARASRAWDGSDRLGELRMPVLVVHGSADRLVDPANARLVADAIPGAELVILEGAGHAYHTEIPERADSVVLDFLRRHRDGGHR